MKFWIFVVQETCYRTLKSGRHFRVFPCFCWRLSRSWASALILTIFGVQQRRCCKQQRNNHRSQQIRIFGKQLQVLNNLTKNTIWADLWLWIWWNLHYWHEVVVGQIRFVELRVESRIYRIQVSVWPNWSSSVKVFQDCQCLVEWWRSNWVTSLQWEWIVLTFNGIPCVYFMILERFRLNKKKMKIKFQN